MDNELLRLGIDGRKIEQVKKSKSFKCHHCELSFVTKTDIEKHLKKEGMVKSFMCTDCGAMYQSEWRLKKHLMSHKNYKTRYCNYYNSNKECPQNFKEMYVW